MKSIGALLMFLMGASAEGTTQESLAAMTTEQYNNIRLQHACLLFIPIVFLYIALSFAWKISVDNEPNTTRDSILYSKFLTQKVEKGKMD